MYFLFFFILRYVYEDNAFSYLTNRYNAFCLTDNPANLNILASILWIQEKPIYKTLSYTKSSPSWVPNTNSQTPTSLNCNRVAAATYNQNTVIKWTSLRTKTNHPTPTVSPHTCMWTHILAPCGESFGGSHMLHTAMQRSSPPAHLPWTPCSRLLHTLQCLLHDSFGIRHNL